MTGVMSRMLGAILDDPSLLGTGTSTSSTSRPSPCQAISSGATAYTSSSTPCDELTIRNMLQAAVAKTIFHRGNAKTLFFDANTGSSVTDFAESVDDGKHTGSRRKHASSSSRKTGFDGDAEHAGAVGGPEKSPGHIAKEEEDKVAEHGTDEDPTKGSTLKVISWNVWMYPDWMQMFGKQWGPVPKKRAKGIVDFLQIQKPDVVVLQSGWNSEAIEDIKKGLGDVCKYYEGDNGFQFFRWLLYGSGVHICSRYPIIEHNSRNHEFDNYTIYDTFVYRGIEKVVIALPENRRLHLFATDLGTVEDVATTCTNCSVVSIDEEFKTNEVVNFVRKSNQDAMDDDLVMITGTFNVDKCKDDQARELQQLMSKITKKKTIRATARIGDPLLNDKSMCDKTNMLSTANTGWYNLIPRDTVNPNPFFHDYTYVGHYGGERLKDLKVSQQIQRPQQYPGISFSSAHQIMTDPSTHLPMVTTMEFM